MLIRIAVILTVSVAALTAAPSATSVLQERTVSVRPAELSAPAIEAVGEETAPPVTLPIREYRTRRTLKRFGMFVDDGRFYGYHLGDDVEYVGDSTEIPVFAIAAGEVLLADWVSGYGGLIVIAHEVGGERINAIYGHLDPEAFLAKQGERVAKGQRIGELGDGHTEETDDRRKHLHFGLYGGDEFRAIGYTVEEEELELWIDPDEFFISYGALDR